MIAAVSAAYFIAPGFFVGLFMDNEAIIDYGSHFLRGMSLAGPFMCIDFLAVGVFQAVGFGKDALVFAILRKIVLGDTRAVGAQPSLPPLRPCLRPALR